MAQKTQFLGFKRALTGTQMDANYLYFLRDAGEREGKLWFNGVCYGSCRDTEIDKVLEALEGFIPASGEVTNVKEYIDNLIGGKDATVSGESSDGHVSVEVVEVDGALTAVTVDTSDIASESAVTTEMNAIEDAVGLNAAGGYIQKSGTNYLDNAQSVEGEISALDTALKSVADQVSGLDYNLASGDSAVLVSLNQTDGKVSAATENIANLKITGYQEGSDVDVAATDTLGEALGKLQGQINAMDLAEVHTAGQPIIAISEEDGHVAATAGTIAAEHVTIADAQELLSGTTVEAALEELALKSAAITIDNADGSINVTPSVTGTDINVNIKSGEKVLVKDGAAGLYTDIKLSGVTPSSTTIKEEYALIGTDGSRLGETVKIYKDSSLVSMQLVEETVSGETKQLLRYTYIDNSGNTQTTDVDVSLLLAESEFKDGLQVNGAGEVSVKKDSTSEDFLSVSSNGVKVSGIQDAIDDAKTAATAYTQSEIQKLDVTGDTAVAGQYVAAIEETDGVVAVKTRANVSEAVLNNYSKGSDATAVAATDTVNEAISKLENQVDAAKAAATTKVEKDANANHITLSSATSVSDGSVTYTIGESDIASATALTETASTLYNMVTAETQTRESEDDRLEELISGLTDDLAAEIAARKAVDGQNGDTYAANTGANYISGATNLNDADVKLDTALKGVDDRLDTVEEKHLTGVTVNGVDATVSANTATVTIDAGDIEVGTALSGTSVTVSADDKVDEVLQSIIDALDNAKSDAYTGVTGTDGSISVTGNDDSLGHDLSVNVKELDLADVQAGETEIKKEEGTGALYGVMYWIDEETA